MRKQESYTTAKDLLIFKHANYKCVYDPSLGHALRCAAQYGTAAAAHCQCSAYAKVGA